jgi:hypothetical protein
MLEACKISGLTSSEQNLSSMAQAASVVHVTQQLCSCMLVKKGLPNTKIHFASNHAENLLITMLKDMIEWKAIGHLI